MIFQECGVFVPTLHGPLYCLIPKEIMTVGPNTKIRHQRIVACPFVLTLFVGMFMVFLLIEYNVTLICTLM